MGLIWFMLKGLVYFVLLFIMGVSVLQEYASLWNPLWLGSCFVAYAQLWYPSYVKYGNWCSFRKLYKFLKEGV